MHRATCVCLIYYLCSSIYCVLNLFFMCVTAVALLTLRKTYARCTWHESGTTPRVCTVYSYAACNGFACALVPREKSSETVRNRVFVRFVHTVHRRNSGFVCAPRKSVINRTKSRFCTVGHTVNRRETAVSLVPGKKASETVCTVYSYGCTVEKNGFARFSLQELDPQRSKNRSTGNSTEPHRSIYHSTEPHRKIYHI